MYLNKTLLTILVTSATPLAIYLCCYGLEQALITMSISLENSSQSHLGMTLHPVTWIKDNVLELYSSYLKFITIMLLVKVFITVAGQIKGAFEKSQDVFDVEKVKLADFTLSSYPATSESNNKENSWTIKLRGFGKNLFKALLLYSLCYCLIMAFGFILNYPSVLIAKSNPFLSSSDPELTQTFGGFTVSSTSIKNASGSHPNADAVIEIESGISSVPAQEKKLRNLLQEDISNSTIDTLSDLLREIGSLQINFCSFVLSKDAQLVYLLSWDEVASGYSVYLNVIDVSFPPSPKIVTTFQVDETTERDITNTTGTTFCQMNLIPETKTLIIATNFGYNVRIYNLTYPEVPSFVSSVLLQKQVPKSSFRKFALPIALDSSHILFHFGMILDLTNVQNSSFSQLLPLTDDVSWTQLESFPDATGIALVVGVYNYSTGKAEVITYHINNLSAPSIDSTKTLQRPDGLSFPSNKFIISDDKKSIFVSNWNYSSYRLYMFDITNIKAPVANTNPQNMTCQESWDYKFSFGFIKSDVLFLWAGVCSHIFKRNNQNFNLKDKYSNSKFGEQMILSSDGLRLFNLLEGKLRIFAIYVDLQMTNYFQPEPTPLAPIILFPDSQNEFAIDGKYVYVAANLPARNLSIYSNTNLGTLIHTKPISRLNFFITKIILVAVQYVFIGGEDGAFILDTSKLPLTTTLSSYFSTRINQTSTYKLKYLIKDDPNTLWVQDCKTLTSFNLSAPTNYNVVLTYNQSSCADNLDINPNGKKAFVIFSGAILAFDLTKNSSNSVNIGERGISFLNVIVPKNDILVACTSSMFYVFNVSNMSNPSLLSQIPIPVLASCYFFLANNGRTILVHSMEYNPYLFTLYIDLTSEGSPTIFGRVFNDFRLVAVAPDNSKQVESSGMHARILNTVADYYFYLPQQNFPMGETCSLNLLPLKINSVTRNYDSNINKFKFISFFQYNVQYSTVSSSLETTLSRLPNWMTFDRENGLVTIQPTQETSLGSYNFFGYISNQITQASFSSLRLSASNLQTLISALTSLGYIDLDGFITSNYDGSKSLEFDPQAHSAFASKEVLVRAILGKNMIGVYMLNQLFVVSSLRQRISPNQLKIFTISKNTVTVQLSLTSLPDLTKPRFVQKAYPITTTIDKAGSSIRISGLFSEINDVFQILVIDFDTILAPSSSCDGIMTIYDGLNPSTTYTIMNISAFLKINEAPIMKIDIQNQINKYELRSEEQFFIQLDRSSFTDKNDLELTYTLAKGPEWLVYKDFTLSGNPPRILIISEEDIVMNVSNGYKHTLVPSKLSIRPTFLSVLNILAAYIGSLLTLYTVYTYRVRIYNILFKKNYIYPKEYTADVDADIASQGIPELSFTGLKFKECQLIIKEIKSILIQKGAVKRKFLTSKESDLVRHFIDKGTGLLDSTKISQAINNAVDSITKRNLNALELYNSDTDKASKTIDEIIKNQFIMMQLSLREEKLTKDIFKKIIKFQNESLSGINKDALKGYLKEVKDQDSPIIKEKNKLSSKAKITPQQIKISRPLSINHQLLEQAMEAYIFSRHSLNVAPFEAEVLIHLKSDGSSIFHKAKQFVRMDLDLLFNLKQGSNYFGLGYDSANSKLKFKGKLKSELEGKTIVVQVVDKEGIILFEFSLTVTSKKLAPSKETNQKIKNNKIKGCHMK